MIKRITYIKNFGVFNSYRRSGDIQDFAKVNILYGWNYSGKTTISRIFQCIENKAKNQHYIDCEFEIEDFDGNKGTQQNLNLNNLDIKVFNSDFIRDNIHLEGESFNPILLLGEETKKAEEEIAAKRIKLNKTHRISQHLNREYLSLDNSILTGLTQRASQIKETLQIVQAFTRTHLKPIFDSIKNNHTDYLLPDLQVPEILKKATATEDDKLQKKDDFIIDYGLTGAIEQTKNLLKIVPQFSNTIQYFVDNPEVANWVELGIVLHEEKDTCKFCGNDLSPERIKEIVAHFSEDLKNHKSDLAQLISDLELEKLDEPIYQKSDIYKDLWSDFIEADKITRKEIKFYNNQLDKLVALINIKKANAFEAFTDFSSIVDNSQLLEQAIAKYNKVISLNNSRTDEFDKTKSDAIESIKKHYTAKFIDEFQVLKKEKKAESYREREPIFISLQSTLEREINDLEATISKAHKGKEKLNEFIQKFLGREEIKVVIVKEGDKERFRLKRNDSKAVNLSEGEKTAIAFSFFLTKLLECSDLSKTIVYIDDPISSLDSNHIFQVNALLKEFFFSKEKPEDVNPTILNCLQLFLSTHNFDFFALLRELPKPKDSNKFYYYIRRINENESILEKLPKSIEHYSSEYHYLFELIYKFNKSEIKDFDTLMGLPNAVRRFVELYTYSRIPGNTSMTVDNRAQKLWGTEKAKRILKVFHYFSHSNNIERMLRNSDLMCDIEVAVKDLMELIAEDTNHFEELERNLN